MLRELIDGLWHTTHPDRFAKILTTGAILPEPDIPDSERWSTFNGPKHYPYVRTIGGVSLFDFEGFDPDVYGEKYPMSSWFNFVPYRREWRCAVWIEIDRDKVGPHFISPADLKTRQDAEGARVHKRMPQIEAAHLGQLPRAAFKRAFLVREGNSDLHRLEC